MGKQGVFLCRLYEGQAQGDFCCDCDQEVDPTDRPLCFQQCMDIRAREDEYRRGQAAAATFSRHDAETKVMPYLSDRTPYDAGMLDYFVQQGYRV